MRRRPTTVGVVGGLCLSAWGAWAQAPAVASAPSEVAASSASARLPSSASARLQLRTLAASCAACHGSAGVPSAGSALPTLAGRPQAELLALLLAFRAGQRPATVMQQLSLGYSPEQLAALAQHFSQLPAPTP